MSVSDNIIFKVKLFHSSYIFLQVMRWNHFNGSCCMLKTKMFSTKQKPLFIIEFEIIFTDIVTIFFFKILQIPKERCFFLTIPFNDLETNIHISDKLTPNKASSLYFKHRLYFNTENVIIISSILPSISIHYFPKLFRSRIRKLSLMVMISNDESERPSSFFASFTNQIGFPLTLEIFPGGNEWTADQIYPIPKQGYKSLSSHYCPSQYSFVMSEVIEKSINNLIFAYLEKYSMFWTHMEYQVSRCTATAVLNKLPFHGYPPQLELKHFHLIGLLLLLLLLMGTISISNILVFLNVQY